MGKPAVYDLIEWHHRLNQVSGSMVLSFKEPPTDATLRGWVAALREQADKIESYINEAAARRS